MNDSEYMRRAVVEARRGVGRTSPNPPVGAVIVGNGQILGTGWHRRAGEAHAEVVAIQGVVRRHGSEALQDATLYVTLEPCSTVGRTGACTEAILRTGISRVVIGACDPNPCHGGRAAGILRKAGLEVCEGIEEPACEELIRPFAKVQGTGLPWVVVKTACSFDGRITRPPGEGSWLSGEASRRDVHLLRSQVDAILTSGRTVRDDNPRLTIRNLDVAADREQPWRVVLTSRESGVPVDCHLRCDEFAQRTLIFVRQRIEAVLRSLVIDQGVSSVMVEAGGTLVGRLIDEEWVDEVVIYLAPLLTGGPTVAVGGEGAESLATRFRLEEVEFARIGNDVRLRGRLGGRGGALAR